MTYRTAYTACRAALRRFFCRYRCTVIVAGRPTTYYCRTFAEAMRWLELNTGPMRAYRIQRSGLIHHTTIIGA